MRLAIYVMHVPGDAAREEALGALTARIEGECDFVIMRDPERSGAWANARRCWAAGVESGADWIVVLNDDALPCEGFVDVAKAALAARSPRDPVCFYTAHGKAAEVDCAWYTTHDGLVGVGCALSSETVREFLAWEQDSLVVPFTDDGRINLWAMATRRLVHTTVPSLVEHQLPAVSTVGNDGHEARTAVVPPGPARDWTAEPKHLGRQYVGNHWELVFGTRPESWDLEAVYLAHRHGDPVSATPCVLIATPAYQPPELAYLESVARTIEDLRAHGIDAIHFLTNGDSLVTRGRHTLVHNFLCSGATHLLQWDADIECLDATAVRRMVESKRPIIGGAYPFRDGSGGVVANLLASDRKAQKVDIREDNTIPVSEVGTGFLMVRRDVLIDMQQRHPEMLYEADLDGYRGCPMWSLFDVALEAGESGRRRYASEDWRFCSVARADGYEVCIYYPPEFRHWGKKAHAGHVVRAWKMGGPKEVRA